jgi:hypothetical protein
MKLPVAAAWGRRLGAEERRVGGDAGFIDGERVKIGAKTSLTASALPDSSCVGHSGPSAS